MAAKDGYHDEKRFVLYGSRTRTFAIHDGTYSIIAQPGIYRETSNIKKKKPLFEHLMHTIGEMCHRKKAISSSFTE